MKTILLLIALHHDPAPRAGRCIKRAAVPRQVKRGLNNAAVVFHSHVARETETGHLVRDLLQDRCLRDAPNYLIAYAAPPRSELGDKVGTHKIIDGHVCVFGLDHCDCDQGATECESKEQSTKRRGPFAAASMGISLEELEQA